MKRIYTLVVFLSLAWGANAQLFMLPAVTGTMTYGTYGVTISSTGSVATGGGSTCFAPTGNQFWIGFGSTAGTYTYTFSKPIYEVDIYAWGINGGPTGSGEYMLVSINGAPYTLTTANAISYNECGGFTGGPCYIPTTGPYPGTWMGPAGPSADYNGGEFFITSCSGIHSLSCYDPGTIGGTPLFGIAYSVSIDTVFGNCSHAANNGPVCLGDTLRLYGVGDTTQPFDWYGPGGFTSTLQNPVIPNVTFADSGVYFFVQVIGGVNDTFRTDVQVQGPPVVTAGNNSPLCAGLADTLHLTATVTGIGDTFFWSGPGGFMDTTQDPQINGFSAPDTGIYKVISKSAAGCLDSAFTHVSLVPPPPAVTITGQNVYCQGMPFIPFVVTGVLSGGTVYWYPSATGGVGTTTAPVVNTSVVGTNTYWANQIIGSCESPRSSITVQVVTTPSAPLFTGNTAYCQYIGPFVPVTVIPTAPNDTFCWYTVGAGGSPVFTEPIPNIDVVPTGNIYHYWVSLQDSGCQGPRTPVNITIHKKPAPPKVTAQSYCQYAIPSTVIAAVDGTDPPEIIDYYGPGVTAATTIAPYPNTSVGPDTLHYYMTETTTYGCVSDSSEDSVIIRVQPTPPITKDTRYCQGAAAAPLNLLVDSLWNSDSLTWYYNTLRLPPVPVPSTTGAPGYTTWWVSQWVNGCQSDSSKVTVQVVYQPQFGIWATSPWVCQFDSLQFAYNGPTMFEPYYAWSLPEGAKFTAMTNANDSLVTVKFDSSDQNYFTINLHASDDSGFCYSDTSLSVIVKPLPMATIYTKNDVCLGDTVQLSLNSRSADAYSYSWYVDNGPLLSSSALNVITYISGTGGPYTISWIDSGEHIITVTTTTQNGCQSAPLLDSVDVHPTPNASFMWTNRTGSCIGDSVLFAAATTNYGYAYEWSPADFFNNNNSSTIWGVLREAQNIITLKVTDPFGCYATQNLEVDLNACCTVTFPNAFTPGGEYNRVFEPIGAQNILFHEFRIANRWGQVVYESASSNFAKWDGTFNGVPQDMGTYYYFVKYDCAGTTMEQKGDVTLIR